MNFMNLYQAEETNRLLVTCALPYVNNMPHLGNLVPIISADVYTRYLTSRGIPNIYICATDEHGTRTEIEAAKKGLDEETYCKNIHEEMLKIFEWFNVDFSYFGRTSSRANHELTRELFQKLEINGYILEKESEQYYCLTDNIFLPDTYIEGICPKCKSKGAKGDQCDQCGSLLTPVDLISPTCILCKNSPTIKRTKNLFIQLDKLAPRLDEWIQSKTHWTGVIKNFPAAWIKDGLIPRAITRNLKWGVKVPKPGYEDQVFYVWFDAPIGYISATKEWAESKKERLEVWWKNDKTKIIHFLGKDNVPFHTILWPATLIGCNDNWNLPFYISSNEYLNYEGGAFSKSRGIGVFSQDVVKMNYPPDLWRFYLMVNRPEKRDVEFSFANLRTFVNGSLISNFGNLIHRLVSFTHKHFQKVPALHEMDEQDRLVLSQTEQVCRSIEESYKSIELRSAARLLLDYGDIINHYITRCEPWKQINNDRLRCETSIHNALLMAHKLLNLMWPMMPHTCEQVLGWMGCKRGDAFASGLPIAEPTILFKQIEENEVQELLQRYGSNAK